MAQTHKHTFKGGPKLTDRVWVVDGKKITEMTEEEAHELVVVEGNLEYKYAGVVIHRDHQQAIHQAEGHLDRTDLNGQALPCLKCGGIDG